MLKGLEGSFHGPTRVLVASMILSCVIMMGTAVQDAAGLGLMRAQRHEMLGGSEHVAAISARADFSQARRNASTNATTETTSNDAGPRYQFMLRSIRYSPACLRLDGATFQRYDCDRTDPQQQFYANGIDPSHSPMGRLAHNITTYNDKILCFSMSDKVEATDAVCVDYARQVELAPAFGNAANDLSGCRRLKWRKNDCQALSFSPTSCIADDVCLAPPSHDQDLVATSKYCLEDSEDAARRNVTWDDTSHFGLWIVFSNDASAQDDPLPDKVSCP